MESPVSASRLPVGSSASSTRGPREQGAGDGRPLHFPAGHFPRLVLQPVAQADAFQQVRPPASATSPRLPHQPTRRCRMYAGISTLSSAVSSGSRW